MSSNRNDRCGKVRPAEEADLDFIELSYQEHFLNERQRGAFTVFREGVYPLRKDAEAALRRGALYVVEGDGMIAGSMIADRIQPAEYRNMEGFEAVSDDEVMVVHLLMVRPSMAHRGFARSLMTFIEALAQREGCRVLRLDTGSQNIPALTLYEKLGFQIKGRASMMVGGRVANANHLFLEKNI